MPWVRSRECNRCGECCRGNPIPDMEPVVPGMCAYYRVENGVGGCSDRTAANQYYTNGCAFWPSIPEHIANYPSCSYTFTWVESWRR